MKCITLVLECALKGSIEDGNEFFPLHAALKLSRCYDCPLLVMRLALELCPKHHFSTPEPLQSRAGPSLLPNSPTAGDIPLHMALSNFSRSVGFKNREDRIQTLCEILEKHPEGAKTRSSRGRLPLHVALSRETGASPAPLPWELLSELFRSHPAAVGEHDIDTDLYPFMMAAEGSFHGADDLLALTASYRLLRSKPDVLAEYASPRDLVMSMNDREDDNNNSGTWNKTVGLTLSTLVITVTMCTIW